MWLLGKLDALRLQIGGDCVYAAYRQAEMIKPLIGRHRRRIDAVAGFDFRNENLCPAQLEIDARLALLRRADHFGAEHALEPLRGRFRIRAAQVNVIPRVIRHDVSPLSGAENTRAAFNATSRRSPTLPRESPSRYGNRRTGLSDGRAWSCSYRPVRTTCRGCGRPRRRHEPYPR